MPRRQSDASLFPGLSAGMRRHRSGESAPGLFGLSEGVRLIGHYGSRKAAIGSQPTRRAMQAWVSNTAPITAQALMRFSNATARGA